MAKIIFHHSTFALSKARAPNNNKNITKKKHD